MLHKSKSTAEFESLGTYTRKSHTFQCKKYNFSDAPLRGKSQKDNRTGFLLEILFCSLLLHTH